ncbi:hypothetical protein C8J57DRAFT_1607569 [Mycena rebaudengoi]|nr:hypothetical protein C8J57DRAFT_1607569 [Mycena rebaudengoi]
MKIFFLVLLASLTLARGSHPEAESTALNCTVLAWVRAEDLAPNRISHGELRIKVPQHQCATKVASVALRLQLREFGEVKYLREGAVFPAIPETDNQTIPDDSAGWVSTLDAAYDYQRADAMGDPSLWVIKAEERQAWATEAVLIDDNPNFSHPIIAPFVVASPAVNYPEVDGSVSIKLSEPISRYSDSDLGYVYVALVTFTDGRTIDVPAGHTTFQPTAPTRSTQAPFTWNVTFTDSEFLYQVRRREKLERCLPKAQRSTFVGEVTLHEGKVMHRGRVVVHATNGSTTMSELSVSFKSLRSDHWANQQAAAGGDSGFYDSTARKRRVHSVLKADREIFDDEYRFQSSYSLTHGPLTSAKPSLDFELHIPHDTPVDIQSYYVRRETALQFSLGALYPMEAAACMEPTRSRDQLEDETWTLNDAERIKEGLWDSYTPVGQPRKSPNMYRRQLSLQADMVVPLVGDAVSGSSPVEHYLTPGVLAPVLLAASQVDSNIIVFPTAQPVFTEEPFDSTAARLLPRPGSSDSCTFLKNRANFNFKYRAGAYAGVLWRKKVVAEERGIIMAPHRDATLQQQPFAAL